MRILSLAFVLLISCMPQSREDQQQIEQIVTGLIDAYNRSDLEQLLSYFHPEADLQPPASPPYHGMESIRGRYTKFFETYVVSISIQPGRIDLSGQLAVHTGNVTGTLINKADSTVIRVNNQYAAILKKDRNQWMIQQLLWNSRQPD
jgi:ketosteroid isomerase-like protein